MDKDELRQLAAQYLISDVGLSVANLVRKIQLAEGHLDCFSTGKKHCDQLSCRWYLTCQQDSGETAEPEQEILLIHKTREKIR